MANIINRQQTFSTNGTVTAAGLHNLIDTALVNSAIIKNQQEITTIGTADLLLIAPDSVDASLAPRKVTVQNLVDDAFSVGTYTSLNLTGALTYGTATGNRTVSTSATITNGTITSGVIPTGTFGTTTSTAATITNGTITTGLIPTLTAGTTTGTAGIFTSGTVATLNSTTGTIGNLSTTLAGDFTISQGTGTLGTTGATLGTYGGATSIPVLAIDAKGRVTTASTSAITSGLTGFRNRIINGDMRIDQRNAGASVTPNDSSYTLDRWKCRLSQSSKYTVQQNSGSVTPPVGFSNYLGVASSSAYSVLTGDYFAVQQIIEGFNFSDFAYGTADAAALTLSFWVRSSLTGTFGGALQNSAENRSYGFTYSISAANTWERKTLAIAGDTSGTWVGSTNGIGLYVNFNLGSGSTYGAATNGAWASGATAFTPSGATSVVGTNGATFYITGVQLEAGSTATEFERRPIGTELALCQRYFIRYINRAMGTMNGTSHLYNGSIAFPVTMRSTPTLVSGASFAVNTGSAGTPALDPTSTNNSAITTVDQAIFWNSSSNWTSNNFASITCSLTSEL
jgi:hypothetical protein